MLYGQRAGAGWHSHPNISDDSHLDIGDVAVRSASSSLF